MRAGKHYPAYHQIVGEILHVSNKGLTESTRTVRAVIISQTLVSQMIAQICRDPEIELVLKDFFDEEGVEIYLKPVSYYVKDKSEVSFDEVLAVSLARGETAIGIDATNQEFPEKYNIILNPDRDRKFEISKWMRVVVIAERED